MTFASVRTIACAAALVLGTTAGVMAKDKNDTSGKTETNATSTTSPGASGSAPGHDMAGPGNSENAPGHDAAGPGNSENAPGHNKTESNGPSNKMK